MKLTASLQTDLRSILLSEKRLKAAMAAAIDEAVKIVHAHFQSDQAEWQSDDPLKPATIRDRLLKGFSAGPILVRSGTLRDQRSVTDTGIADDARSGFIESKDLIAKIQNAARPFYTFTKEEEQQIRAAYKTAFLSPPQNKNS